MTNKQLQKILYVEDEPDIQTVAAMALESLGGFELLSCNSGNEALAKAPSFAPDLILLDVMMPEMDGPALLKALRAIPELVSTPVVFMTRKVQRQEIAHYRSLGALDVIHKPFDPMTLTDQVLKIWRNTGD